MNSVTVFMCCFNGGLPSFPIDANLYFNYYEAAVFAFSYSVLLFIYVVFTTLI